jgi:uncharacterized RDD family membrane protein YckC
MPPYTVTTPEHVEIRLEPAGAGSRFLAIMIDSTITLGASITVARLAILLLPSAVAGAIFITLSFLLTWGWHVWFETRGHGRTPGKRALSLRVVDARGLPVSLYQSLARNIVRVVDFAPAFYGVGAAVSLFDPARRRLGDIVAGTLVIREAQPLAYTGQLAAERRHNSLRTPRVLRLIRHRIPLEEREFLLRLCLRADKLTPSARYDLMEDVARYYRRKLSIEEEQISGENLVRDLTAVLFAPESR